MQRELTLWIGFLDIERQELGALGVGAFGFGFGFGFWMFVLDFFLFFSFGYGFGYRAFGIGGSVALGAFGVGAFGIGYRDWMLGVWSWASVDDS
jgi:hypothetical protein